jgi:DNA processing protein
MARGIDTSAHKAVLKAGGNTIAVFGCGVDVLYPSENRKLMDDIAANGLLISEFAMGAPAYPQNFPIRNRIISGMSVGIVVVEGAQYSGSAITAKLALEQGRELFAVPGNVTSSMSWGPNLLIKQGAKLVQDWNDVVEELPPDARRRLIAEGQGRILKEDSGPGTSGAGQASLPFGPNSEIARSVLAQLKIDSAIQIDNLLETLENYSPSEIVAALFELEMLGLVRQLPGRSFVRVW